MKVFDPRYLFCRYAPPPPPPGQCFGSESLNPDSDPGFLVNPAPDPCFDGKNLKIDVLSFFINKCNIVILRPPRRVFRIQKKPPAR